MRSRGHSFDKQKVLFRAIIEADRQTWYLLDTWNVENWASNVEDLGDSGMRNYHLTFKLFTFTALSSSRIFLDMELSGCS